MKRTLLKIQLSFLLIALSFTAKSQFVDLHDCSNSSTDGLRPYGSLITDNTYLYGTMNEGGDSGKGCVFRIMPDGTDFTILHSFAGGISDGSGSYGRLLLDSNYLYGMTFEGGLGDNGTIYSLKTDGTGYKVLHMFNSSNGKHPMAGVIVYNDTLYGTTSEGGLNSNGIIFKIAKDGSGFSDMRDLVLAEGVMPTGSLTFVPTDTSLYGTTYWGGVNNNGVIFKIHPDGSGFRDVFVDTVGKHPKSTLLYDNGNLLGTTYGGGSMDYGVAFLIDLPSSYQIIHDFSGDSADGGRPSSMIFNQADTSYYGVCERGGNYSHGTIFKISRNGRAFTKLHDFSDSLADGANPYAPPTLLGNQLYGVTPYGGAINFGMVYKFGSTFSGFNPKNALENTINIYPNPSKGAFSIESSKTDLKRVEIENAMGEKVHEQSLISRHEVLDLKLSPGIYIIKVLDSKNQYVRKIIIN